MSAKIIQHPAAGPAAAWPGRVEVDRRGAAMAIQMLFCLDSYEDEAAELTVADRCALENWPRQGRPFRSIVAEYLVRAQAVGPATVEGFCAILSDYIACTRKDLIPEIVDYDRYLGDDPE